METEPRHIKKLARLVEEENRDFKLFLEAGGVKEEMVDEVFSRLFDEITAAVDCRSCSNCCKQASPIMDEEDVEVMARGQGLKTDVFEMRYLTPAVTREGMRFRDKPCRFLKGTWCSCYEYRPKDCRDFPHSDAGVFLSRMQMMLDNCSVCPIIFNVIEAAKKELGGKAETLSDP